MATKGMILENKDTGDTYEFLETPKETNGERLSVKTTLLGKGKVVPDHIHILQDETFEVLEGELTIVAKGVTSVIRAGEKAILPKGEAHNHYNMAEVSVTFIQTITPALDFELLFENLIGMAADGKLKNGKAGILQELVTLKYLDSKIYLADLPIGTQKFAMNTIAPLARVFGYRASYKKYAGVEK